MKYEIENRGFRNEIIGHLMDLSNQGLQLREWCKPSAAHFFWDNMRFAIGFLLDHLGFCDENPEAQIGYTIYDDQELKVMRDAAFALRRVIKEIGVGQPDEKYFSSPLWQDVIDKSKIALDLLTNNDARLNTH